MNEELTRLVYDYSINCRIADKEFYNKAISIILAYTKLDGFVKKIEFTKDEDSYTHNSYVLSFSDQAVYEYSMMYWHYNSSIKYFFINLEVLMVILHEIEHVKQEKYCSTHKNFIHNLYGTLIEYSNVYWDPRARKMLGCKDIDYDFYISNHGHFPVERLANILSTKGICDLTMHDKVFFTTIRKYFRDFYWKECFRYYKNDGQIIESPLEKFLSIIEASKDVLSNNSLFKEIYPFEEKLLYGLPINDKEYSRLTKKIHK